MRKAIIPLLLAAITLAGCSQSSEPPVDGTLELVTIQSGEVEERLVIGVLEVTEPGAAIFDEPDGITIGRVGPGDYPVVKTESDWAMVYLGDEGEAPGYGWAPLTSNSVLKTN